MKPLYFRWAFRPSDGSVELAHNQEDHPAQVRTHTDLAHAVNEPDAPHGYAWRIGNGFRVFDYDYKPLEDPYVRAAVLRTLGAEDAPAAPWTTEGDPDLLETGSFQYGRPRH